MERRRAHAPAELQLSHEKDDARGRKPDERASPQRREPEYGKEPHGRATPSPALSPRQTEDEYASAAENTSKPHVANSDDPFEDSSSDEQVIAIIDAYSHGWSLQPPTSSPAYNLLTEPELETEFDEARAEEITYFQRWSDLQPHTPSPAPSNPPSFQPARHAWSDRQEQRRGEFEGIVNKLTMPDQESSRRERDTYQAHVTRKKRDGAGKEYF